MIYSDCIVSTKEGNMNDSEYRAYCPQSKLHRTSGSMSWDAMLLKFKRNITQYMNAHIYRVH